MRTLILPAWLTVGVLPFLAVFALAMVYGTAFAKVNVLTNEAQPRRRAKIALFAALHVDVRAVGSIRAEHLQDATRAASFRGAWRAARCAIGSGRRPATDG